MPEPNKFSLVDAALPDGTIDFYALLCEPVDTPAETLKGRIQALYSEAQANRDHRNLNRRREYQTIIELMPGARAALLDAEKRQRYDAYLTAAKSGTNTPDFEEFMNDLLGLSGTMEEKTDILGVQDKASEPKARVLKAPAPAKTPAKTSPTPAPATSGPAQKAIIGGVVGLLLGTGAGHVLLKNVMHHNHAGVPSVLLGIVVGALVFVALNRKPGQKVGR